MLKKTIIITEYVDGHREELDFLLDQIELRVEQLMKEVSFQDLRKVITRNADIRFNGVNNELSKEILIKSLGLESEMIK